MYWLMLLGLIGPAFAGNTSPSTSCGKLDLLFVLDSSGSIAFSGWELTLQTVRDMVALFTIGPNDVDVAMLSFSRFPSTRIDMEFGFPKTKADILGNATTSQMAWIGSQTHTHEAIAAAGPMFDAGRDDAPDVMVIITDGVPCCSSTFNNLTLDELAALDQSIVRFAIGVGNINQDFLEELASDDSKVFMPANFQELVQLSLDLANTVCGIGEAVICDPWKWFDASSYKFCRTRMNYEKAKAVCEGMDAHIVEINNAAEHVFVSDLTYHSRMRCSWIGGIKYEHWHDSFHWETTGQQFWPCPEHIHPCPFEVFSPGQPDGENWAKCVQLDLNYPNNGRWDDVNCFRWRTFTCERDCCKPPLPEGQEGH